LPRRIGSERNPSIRLRGTQSGRDGRWRGSTEFQASEDRIRSHEIASHGVQIGLACIISLFLVDSSIGTSSPFYGGRGELEALESLFRDCLVNGDDRHKKLVQACRQEVSVGAILRAQKSNLLIYETSVRSDPHMD